MLAIFEVPITVSDKIHTIYCHYHKVDKSNLIKMYVFIIVMDWIY